MIKILCPTDFSDHSKKAIEYAFNICKALDAELYLITTFVEHRHGSSFKSVKDYIKERNEKELEQLVNEFQTIYNLKNTIHYSVLQGHTTDMINYYAKSNSIDVIILGTQGSKSINNRLFGSTTSKLIKQTKIPIIAIPYFTNYNFGAGHYLMAVDDKAIYKSPAFELINKLCENLNKKVDLIHINKEETEGPSSFDPFISEYLDGNIAEVIVKKGDDAVDYIHEYIEEHSVELLIMIRHEHTLINRLMFSSNTDREIAQSKIPIMIITEQ